MAGILPVFLTFAACGNRCIFCDQSAITRTEEQADVLSSAINQIKKWMNISSNWQELAFYGGNFGALPADIRRELYCIVKNFNINRIRFSTRPDTITDELLSEIEKNNVTFVELGVQSLDDNVLAINGRPYDKKIVFEAIKRLLTVVPCGVQLMTGMYHQDAASSIEDAKVLSKTGISAARIYPTLVLKGTGLHLLLERGDYKPMSLPSALLSAAGMFVIFKSDNIPVIRMGLPEDAAEDGRVAAGPHHKAFGDLVKTLVVLLYFHSGERCRFFGYKGIVRRFFWESFPADKNLSGVDFNHICRRVRRYFLEDSQRFLEGEAANFAERLIRETYNR